MAFLHMPRVSRKMQKTLKNLRVSFLCFLLTFLVLRNTIGAGKFGTPAQDFEEIRQHLHHVRLHRRQARVLAEAVEEEQKQREAPILTVEGSSPWLAESIRRKSALSVRGFEEEQGNAPIVRQGNAPLLTSRPLQGGLLTENVGLWKDLEGSRNIESRDAAAAAKQKVKEALVHRGYGASRVLLLAGVQSSGCKNPAGEHFLLKSLKNKVDYTTLHGLEVSLSFGGVDPETSKPLSKLSLLQRTMVKYPHVEWLWWMPGDALITDMARTLPMAKYADFNLVLFGSDDNSPHQKSLINLNTDSFLIRNSAWSLDLLRACVRTDTDQARRLLTNYLMKGPHVEANSDQCALISNSNQKKDEFADKIYVQNAAVLRGNWRYVVEKVERIEKQSRDEKLPFITHFLGCDACKKAENEVCAMRIERVVAHAEKQSMRSNVTRHRGLAAS